jgi:NOL1/NOP2/fmu family ribosome biogenesis protein
LIRIGKERIRAFSGSLSTEEISKIVQLLSVEGIGLYLGKETEDAGIRLSVDALHVLKDLEGDIIEFNEEQEGLWFKGKNVELTSEQQEKYKSFNEFVAVMSEKDKDFIGTGKISGDKKVISNFLPKERTVRN